MVGKFYLKKCYRMLAKYIILLLVLSLTIVGIGAGTW